MALNANALTKHKNAVLNVLILILAIFIAHNIYKTQVSKEHLLQGEKEDEIKKNEVLLRINTLEKNYSSYKDFFNKKDISSVIDTINNIAKKFDVKILSVRPQVEKDNPDYLEYSFLLTLNADNYHVLGQFISRLESSPDIYSIGQLAINPRYETSAFSKQTEQGISVTLTVNTFLLK